MSIIKQMLAVKAIALVGIAGVALASSPAGVSQHSRERMDAMPKKAVPMEYGDFWQLTHTDYEQGATHTLQADLALPDCLDQLWSMESASGYACEQMAVPFGEGSQG